MKSCPVVFIVVIYGIELLDSKTIVSIINSECDLKLVKLIVWNNGPNTIKPSVSSFIQNVTPLFGDVVIYESLRNCSLSHIYNFIIDTYIADKFVILDGDSSLSKDYINTVLMSSSEKILVPLLKDHGRVESPRGMHDGCLGPYVSSSRIFAVSSGLVVPGTIIASLKKRYTNVFDERFVLYGVDTTFFERIYKSGLINEIIIVSGFEHSFSRLNNEEIDNKFRCKERAYDYGLTIRYYPRIFHFFSFILFVFKVVLRRAPFLLVDVIRAISTGVHYRVVTPPSNSDIFR